jgi:hypothetical protein
MCYSGKCRWEGYMGDCAFPRNKKVREKYPLPVCDIPQDEDNKEYLDNVEADIRKILEDEKQNQTNN